MQAINWRLSDREKSLPNSLPCAADGNSPPSQLFEALCRLRDLIGKSSRTQSLIVGDHCTETVHGLIDSTSSSELVHGDLEAVPHTGELVEFILAHDLLYLHLAVCRCYLGTFALNTSKTTS